MKLNHKYSFNLIKPGDIILYGISDLLGWIIAIKTWTKVCHVEMYVGNNKSIASRNGIGVNLYPFREDHIVAVLRPPKSFNINKALNWFNNEAKGQTYDWKGLLCFTLAIKQGSKNKMFCSEFIKRLTSKGNCDVISKWWDADKTSPSMFLSTPVLKVIYVKEGIL